jgi:hypothetical protein
MATTDQPHNSPGEPGHPGKPGRKGEPTGRGGGGGEGGAGGRGGGDSGEPGGQGGAGGPGGAGRSYGRDDSVSRWLDWTVRIVVVASIVLNAFVAKQVFAESQCQAKFNDRVTALTPATTKERDTQRATDAAESQLWLSVKPGDQTAEQKAKIQALFTAYQQTLTARNAAQAEADKARAAHPLPDCDGPQ